MTTVRIQFEIPNHSREWLQFGVDIAYIVNCKLYSNMPDLPRITPDLVKFNALMNVQSTDCVNTLLANEIGECKDISAALAAYYTIRLGILCTPLVVPVYDRSTGEQKTGAWHCVMLINGKEYDPNYIFGMGEI